MKLSCVLKRLVCGIVGERGFWAAHEAMDSLRSVINGPIRLPDTQSSAGFIGDPCGLNIVGAVDSEGGVAEATRGYVLAAKTSGIPYALNNFRISRSMIVDRQYEDEVVSRHPYGVNLICINGNHTSRLYRQAGPDYFAAHYNIGCWVWELASFPEKWSDVLSLYDEIWAPTAFCKSSFTRSANVQVKTVPYVIEPPSVSPDAKSHLGIPENTFMFLFMFDFYSVFERKNPLAIIEAFQKAFSPGEPVVLVIKSLNAEISPYNCARLKNAGRGHSVMFLDQHMSRAGSWGLLAGCDAYISLHRSEGFGLTLAEAMSLAKPVIATNYSGNTDYMTAQNSFPVRYQLKELDRTYGPYEKGNVWADPDIDHAAECMRQAYDNRGQAKKIGLRAAKDIARTHGPREIGRRIKNRLVHISRAHFGIPFQNEVVSICHGA